MPATWGGKRRKPEFNAEYESTSTKESVPQRASLRESHHIMFLTDHAVTVADARVDTGSRYANL